MDLFVKDKYYNIDSKRDLDVCLKENGFNYDELESMMLFNYHNTNYATGVEGLIGDDLYQVQHAINSELSDLENEIKNLKVVRARTTLVRTLQIDLMIFTIILWT